MPVGYLVLRMPHWLHFCHTWVKTMEPGLPGSIKNFLALSSYRIRKGWFLKQVSIVVRIKHDMHTRIRVPRSPAYIRIPGTMERDDRYLRQLHRTNRAREYPGEHRMRRKDRHDAGDF